MLVGLEGDVVKTLQSIKKGIAMLDERRSELIDGRTPDNGVADTQQGGSASPTFITTLARSRRMDFATMGTLRERTYAAGDERAAPAPGVD